MANLKIDLSNKIKNDQYYNELELARLAQDPAMKYQVKIQEMDYILHDLVMGNAKLGLVEQYFKEPEVQQQAAPVANQPQAAPIHQGQTHGE